MNWICRLGRYLMLPVDSQDSLNLFGGCIILVYAWDNFQLTFAGGWAETKTGFCSSSKQPNTQPKKILIVTNFKFVALNIAFFFDMMIAATHRGIYMCEGEWSGVEVQYYNHKNCYMPWFFHHQRIHPKLQLWLLLREPFRLSVKFVSITKLDGVFLGPYGIPQSPCT